MELTKAEKRDLIFRVCMAACSRELARIREEG